MIGSSERVLLLKSHKPIPVTISGKMAALDLMNNRRFIHTVEKSKKMKMKSGLMNNR
jgi:hypothetical protein